MHGLAIKLFFAVLAAALTLGVVALAAATTGSDEPSAQPSGSVAPASLAPTSGSAGDVPEIEALVGPTSEPVPGAPTEPSVDADTGESPKERTTALNPAGRCVDLPDSSNIIEEPDKHPNWTVQPCEPDGDATDTQEPEDDHGAPDGEQPEDNGGGPPQGRTPALNPDGVCIEMPNNSDIVQHPEKHAAWTVGACSTSGNTIAER